MTATTRHWGDYGNSSAWKYRVPSESTGFCRGVEYPVLQPWASPTFLSGRKRNEGKWHNPTLDLPSISLMEILLVTTRIDDYLTLALFILPSPSNFVSSKQPGLTESGTVSHTEPCGVACSMNKPTCLDSLPHGVWPRKRRQSADTGDLLLDMYYYLSSTSINTYCDLTMLCIRYWLSSSLSYCCH